MNWILIVLYTGSATVIPMDSKQACEQVRLEIQAAYGKSSSYVAATCTAVPAVPAAPPRKP